MLAFAKLALIAATVAVTSSRSVAPLESIPEKFPPNFAGHSASAVFGAAAQMKRDEFQTSDEYRARRSRSVKGGTYVFVWRSAAPSYHADNQTYTFRLPTAPYVNQYDVTSNEGYQLAHEALAGRRYEASNAFGKKVTVTETVFREYLALRADSKPITESLELFAARAIAPHWKRRLRPAVALHVTDESLMEPINESNDGGTGFFHAAPTIDDPTEVSEFQFATRVDVLELLVIDLETGRIAARFDSDGTPLRITSPFKPVRRIESGMDEADVLNIMGRDPDSRQDIIVNGDRFEEWHFVDSRTVVRFDAFGHVVLVDLSQ